MLTDVQEKVRTELSDDEYTYIQKTQFKFNLKPE
jgi:hypothetical protein